MLKASQVVNRLLRLIPSSTLSRLELAWLLCATIRIQIEPTVVQPVAGHGKEIAVRSVAEQCEDRAIERQEVWPAVLQLHNRVKTGKDVPGKSSRKNHLK